MRTRWHCQRGLLNNLHFPTMNVRHTLPALLLAVSWNLCADDRFDGPGPGYRKMASPQGELKPIDGMPVIGDQTPEVLRRLKELEDRLSRLEKSQGKASSPEVPKVLGDAGDIFVRAYMKTQEAARSVAQKNYAAGLATLQEADGMLAKLQEDQPDWQPQILKYRRARIAEQIADAQKALKAEESAGVAKPGAEKP